MVDPCSPYTRSASTFRGRSVAPCMLMNIFEGNTPTLAKLYVGWSKEKNIWIKISRSIIPMKSPTIITCKDSITTRLPYELPHDWRQMWYMKNRLKWREALKSRSNLLGRMLHTHKVAFGGCRVCNTGSWYYVEQHLCSKGHFKEISKRIGWRPVLIVADDSWQEWHVKDVAIVGTKAIVLTGRIRFNHVTGDIDMLWNYAN